jgi:catechol 2,3-dioxygenase-like lactoylglutathione lyase family enzyme
MIPFKFSNCVCLSTPEHDRAVDFYRNVLGLAVKQSSSDSVELSADPYRLYIDRSDSHGNQSLGMVLELSVPDLEAARTELEKAGCTVVRWEGKGKDCYVRDPFGVVFNLWEE